MDVLFPVRNELITDRNMVFAIMWNLAKETARERIIESQVKQKQYYDKGTKIINYEMGDQVLAARANNLSMCHRFKRNGLHLIVQKCKELNITVTGKNGLIL